MHLIWPIISLDMKLTFGNGSWGAKLTLALRDRSDDCHMCWAFEVQHGRKNDFQFCKLGPPVIGGSGEITQPACATGNSVLLSRTHLNPARLLWLKKTSSDVASVRFLY